MLNIEIFTEGNATLPFKSIQENFFLTTAETTLILTGTDNVAVNIILTDNEYIKVLNSGHRGKNVPTDVISFAYRDEPFPVIKDTPEELGDIYISLEKASEQAAEYGTSLADELKRLVIHGVLHLLGYDHEKSLEDHDEMSSLEEKIFSMVKT